SGLDDNHVWLYCANQAESRTGFAPVMTDLEYGGVEFVGRNFIKERLLSEAEFRSVRVSCLALEISDEQKREILILEPHHGRRVVGLRVSGSHVGRTWIRVQD